MKFKVIALANTFALIDIVLHPLFHVWGLISPDSYVSAMHLFVLGLQLKVEPAFDLSLGHILLGTVIETAAFWLLGAAVGLLYNRLSR